MKKSLTLLLLFSSISYAKIAGVNKLKDELNVKSSRIVKLGAEIKTIEKSLNLKNDEYLTRLKRLKSVESKVDTLMSELKVSQEDIHSEKERLKKIAQTYLLEKKDDADDNSLISQVLLEKSLSSKVKTLNKLKNDNQRLVETISEYSRNLTELQTGEQELYDLILSLENRKKEISQNYISNLETKNELEEKLENALAVSKAKNLKHTKVNPLDIDFEIILPIKKFSDYKGGKEGVTFKYDSIEPLIACADGQVEYAGELASYGKVIILKHGKDIRSVILGEIKSKVQKGQAVRQGQIIGYTIANPGIKKSLYYEIRKKNKVQNTLSWLKRRNKKLL